MDNWRNEARSDYDAITIPFIRVAFVLSLLLHAAVLWWPWPEQPRFPSLEDRERGRARGSLTVQLAQPLRPPADSRAAPEPAPDARPSRPRRLPPARARGPIPEVVALNRPPPGTPSPLGGLRLPSTRPSTAAPSTPASSAIPSPVPPESTPLPPGGDLSSYIEARRRLRGESESLMPPSTGSSAPPTENENQRHNRIVAANLGLRDNPTFGNDPTSGGGVFQIQRMGYDDAEFTFFGWNDDIRRNSRRLIEVRRGAERDIRLAVIHKVIAIIRENRSGEFVWISQRLGRSITLSAAPEENAGLEDFMMREFFDASTVLQ
jgi:hypothetical protein